MNWRIWALNEVQIVVSISLHVPKPMDIKESKPQVGGVTCGRQKLDWWKSSAGEVGRGWRGRTGRPPLYQVYYLKWVCGQIGVHIIILYTFFRVEMFHNKTNLQLYLKDEKLSWMEEVVLVQNEWLDWFKLHWKSSAPCNLTSKTEFYKFKTILTTAQIN